MDAAKQKAVFKQYIDQYQLVIDSKLTALRSNEASLHIPYGQFLFSVIDYYALIYLAATIRRFRKRDPQNFKDFFSSAYFPVIDQCKASFLYFIRNGVVHQIFAKGCSIGVAPVNQLFFKDTDNGDIPALNLSYLDCITIKAVEKFINDLKIRCDYIDNVHDLLIASNYGFNDHTELSSEISNTFGGDINKVFTDCS